MSSPAESSPPRLIPQKNLRGAHSETVLIFASADQTLQPLRRRVSVVIERADELTLGGLDTLVHRAAKASVGLVLDELCAGSGGNLGRCPVTAIVDDDRLELPEGLSPQGVKTTSQFVARRNSRNDDRRAGG